MCGLAGLVRNRPLDGSDPEAIRRMMDTLQHRGPDDRGLYTNSRTAKRNGVVLGHRRLSIIDPETGREPLVDPSSGLVLIFNGEIYNHQSLRRQCRSSVSYDFQTETDPEVLLPLYRQHGTDVVQHLRGMFAFALWDPRRERLVLGRDRVGQKPLFYRSNEGDLSFASELAPLAEESDSLAVSRNALYLYTVLGYIPAPYTIYRGIWKLPPGTLGLWTADGLQFESYWSVPKPVSGGTRRSPGRLRREFLHRFREAVRLRLQSDVPLGAFLSGGIDSSAVVGMMSRLEQDSVRTFSIGFPSSRFDETDYARQQSDYAGTNHRNWTVDPGFLDLLPTLARHYGEPFGDSSAVPTYVLSRNVSDHVKVALSGDGGDECFGGYNRYRAMKLLGSLRFLSNAPLPGELVCALARVIPVGGNRLSVSRIGARLLNALPGSPAEQYLEVTNRFSPSEARGILRPGVRPDPGGLVEELHHELMTEAGPAPAAAAAAYTDLNLYLPGDLLVKLDIASMANSLEVRCPFLDHELIAFSARVPDDVKTSLRRTKPFLRDALADLMPPSIRRREKMGFGVPVGKWFRNGRGRRLLEDLTASNGGVTDYYHPEAVRTLVDEHLAEDANHRDRLWQLVMFQIWHREFMG